MTEFKDKVVIVTGASSGIGAVTAVEYAKQGAKLVLSGRNEENLDRTVQQCMDQGLTNDMIRPVIGDLNEEEVCNRIVDEAVKCFGQLDVLVNNAGGVVAGNVERCTVEDLDSMYNIYVRAMFITCKRAIPHLIKTKGSILNIGGTSAKRPLKGATAITITKAAIASLTSSIALDVADKGVRINCLALGLIETGAFTRPGGPMAAYPEHLPQFMDSIASKHPMKRAGKPDEVAKLVLFLTSNSASFMTGATIPLDGGYHIAGPE